MSVGAEGTLQERAGSYDALKSSEWLIPRPPKSTSDDDVCECDPASGCEEDCLNRLLYVECNAKTCPCRKRCTNRRFQQRSGAKLEKFDAGPKGWGLRSKDALSSGDFVGEYVGEVIAPDMVMERKEEYKRIGAKHFFFMNLSKDEVIDSARKGGITRFINHSCEPNCELQKWSVNGEWRLGFFATDDIDGMDELGFDYKYERGDIVQQCFCGAETCRGEIMAGKTSSGSSGKRRRVNPEVQAERDLQSFRRKLWSTCKIDNQCDGISQPAVIMDLLKLMMAKANTDEKKAEVLTVIQQTSSSEGCLNKFLVSRGMRILKIWLESVQDIQVIRQLFALLDVLPVATKNIIDTSRIMADVEAARVGDDEVLASLAAKLTDSWAELKSVYVIPKSQEESVSEVIPVPRRWLKKFQASALRMMEGGNGARADWTKDNSNPETRDLRITGTDVGVQAVSEIVKRVMVDEAEQDKVREEEKQRRRMSSGGRSTTGSEEDLNSPAAKRRRTSSADGAYSDAAEILEIKHDPVRSAHKLKMMAEEQQRDLPSPWRVLVHPDGLYYWNDETNKTTWDKPTISLADRPEQSSLAGAIYARTASRLVSKVEGTAASKNGLSGSKKERDEAKKAFQAQVSKTVIKVLGRYSKKECAVGRITNGNDFKHLARKFTHIIAEKESTVTNTEGGTALIFGDTVKHKVKNFVKGQMQKMGPVYARKSNGKRGKLKGKRRSSPASK